MNLVPFGLLHWLVPSLPQAFWQEWLSLHETPQKPTPVRMRLVTQEHKKEGSQESVNSYLWKYYHKADKD